MIKSDVKLELDKLLINPLIRKGDSLDDYIILDIETTGFSGDYNMIYLIGCIYYKENSFYMTQFLCERKEDEYEMLFCFSQFLNQFKYVIHYNGTGFDMPFIKKRFNNYNIKSKISELTEIDLYLRLKPFQRYLPTENLKLKAIEKYFGYSRKDCYDGGQLIQIFKDFIVSPTTKIKNKLLLHNKEDLLGLFQCFKSLDLLIFFEKAVSEEIEISNINTIIDNSSFQIVIPYSFNNCFSFDLSTYKIILSPNKITIKISIIKDTLNYYYKDYKNYYYLRAEQQVVHKSIAKYVDNAHKEKVTRENCYIKKRGTFVPLIKNMNHNSHIFKYHYSSKETYVELTEQLINNKDALSEFTKCILSLL